MLAAAQRHRDQSGRLALFALAWWACWLLAWTTPAFAQAPAATPAATPEEATSLSTADVQAEMRAVQDSSDLTAEQKEAVLATYQQALEELRLADDWKAKAARYRQTTGTAATDLEAVKSQLASDPPKPEPIPPDVAGDFDKLKQEQARAEAAAVTAQQERNDLDTRIRRRVERAEEISLLDTEAKRKIAEIDDMLAQPAQAEAGQQAQRLLLQARRERALAQRAAFAEELVNYDATRDLLRAQLDLAKRRARLAQEAADRWKQARADFEKSQANLEAINAQRSVITARPEVERIAQYNKDFAEERKADNGPAALLADVESQVQETEQRGDELTRRFERVKSSADLGAESGVRLLRYRDQLPDARELRQKIIAREEEIQRVKVRLIELKSRRSSLEDIDEAAKKFVDSLGVPLEPAVQTDVLREATRLLETQREYIDTLISDYEKYVHGLVNELDPAERELLATITEFADYISERVLWVKSVPPWGHDDVQKSWAGLLWLADPRRWSELGQGLWDDARHSPLIYLLAMAVGGVLLFSQRRLRHRVRATGEAASQSYATSIRPTLDVLALTIAISVSWPLVMWFVAWRLTEPWDAEVFPQSVAWALNVTALVLLSFELLRQVCRKKGLAEVHFAWPEDSVRSLRRNSRWLMIGVIPLVFVIAMIAGSGDLEFEASLGRLAFMIGMVLLAIFARRVIHGVHVLITEHFSSDRRIPWVDGTKFLWFPAAVVIPLILAVVAALGYYFTALLLAWRVQATLWLAFALLVIHSLALRMLLIARRNVAIRQARERRAQLAKASDTPEQPGSIETQVVNESQQIDLSSINLQIRRLLNTAMVVALVGGSWLIWVNVLPALRVFDQWTLWSDNVTVVDLFMSIVLMLLTIVASRNLPGLLEITWLQRLPLDAGARYAVTTLARYIVTLVGMLLAFQWIGITWSSVQWLAAAVTVGLGFGLQEIFANFVSGIIILFERPMRVGDVVTIGDVSGVVTRIRTRATTIRNWDHKELIVPNKEFITGRLINWTLSDTILRVSINVGVAYGTDPVQTTQLLTKIAKEHPMILSDPAPGVAFTSFGDNTLNFEVRVFVPNLAATGAVQQDLMVAIDREFKAAGIEIAFPQRDLHLRSVDPSILDRMRPMPKEATSS